MQEPKPLKPLTSKTLEVKICAKNHGSIFDIMQHALKVVKAFGHDVYVEFPRGYSVRVWPDSHIYDLLLIEELQAKIANEKEK